MSDHTYCASPRGMADTGPACQGLLTVEETLELLSTLLHVERAGVRVCVLSPHGATSRRYRQLLRDFQKDEAESCRGLRGSLTSLGGEPDNMVGDFAAKCLTMANPDDRLRYRNRARAGWQEKFPTHCRESAKVLYSGSWPACSPTAGAISTPSARCCRKIMSNMISVSCPPATSACKLDVGAMLSH